MLRMAPKLLLIWLIAGAFLVDFGSSLDNTTTPVPSSSEATTNPTQESVTLDGLAKGWSRSQKKPTREQVCLSQLSDQMVKMSFPVLSAVNLAAGVIVPSLLVAVLSLLAAIKLKKKVRLAMADYNASICGAMDWTLAFGGGPPRVFKKMNRLFDKDEKRQQQIADSPEEQE